LPRTARLKTFCPRCEEVYIPKVRNINVDGACFGTSFPHTFLLNYPNAVILPPKVYLHEPKIFGFKIYGKRGSKFFKPAEGIVRTVENDFPRIDMEKRDNEVKRIIAAMTKKEAGEVEKDQVVGNEGNKKKKNRNKNKKKI